MHHICYLETVEQAKKIILDVSYLMENHPLLAEFRGNPWLPVSETEIRPGIYVRYGVYIWWKIWSGAYFDVFDVRYDLFLIVFYVFRCKCGVAREKTIRQNASDMRQ